VTPPASTASQASGLDPGDGVLALLAAGLRGPRRIRADLLAELRDGLDDATDDLVASGLDRGQARHQAVAEFGDPVALARELQVELAGAQARRTAVAVALVSLLVEAAWNWGYPAMMRSFWLRGGRPTESAFLAQLNDLQTVVVWIVTPLLLLTCGLSLRRAAAVRRSSVLIGALAAGLLTVNVLTSGVMTALNPGLIEALRDSPTGMVLQFGSLAAMLGLALTTARTLRLLAFVPRGLPHRE
jgi:hypothetical protein